MGPSSSKKAACERKTRRLLAGFMVGGLAGSLLRLAEPVPWARGGFSAFYKGFRYLWTYSQPSSVKV